MFAPADYSRLQTALASPRGLIELAVIAVCVLVAWAVDRRIERVRTRNADLEHAAVLPGFAHAFFPLCALGLVYAARLVYRHYAPPFFSDIALPLLVAFAVIRMLVYALRRLFPTQSWLPAWERAISTVVFLMLALHYVGVLPEIASELDAMVLPVGTAHLSVLAMGKGALLVIVTVVVTLWLSGLIERRLVTSTPLEGNLRVVLARLVRAALLVIAVLFSLQAVGIDLTLLTVFGGALGVGIGLGLQKLASNYIAGFTILIDRSVRIGDLVTIDNRHGTVAKVTARYVVVRSLDGLEAIIPNETLVTSTVLNHSYTSKDVRVALPLQVSFDADIERAIALLEELARTEPRTLSTPEPRAFVVKLADSGIDLELGVWINDPEAGLGDLRSNLYRKIVAAFREQGIAIAFPRTEMRLVGAPPAAQAASAQAGSAAQATSAALPLHGKGPAGGRS